MFDEKKMQTIPIQNHSFYYIFLKILHRRVLIDSGDMDTGDQYTALLRDVLAKENATIEHLIVTHWHHDHIGGIKAVQSLLKGNPKSSPTTVWKLPRSSGDPGGEQEEKSAGAWSPLNVKAFFSTHMMILSEMPELLAILSITNQIRYSIGYWRIVDYISNHTYMIS